MKYLCVSCGAEFESKASKGRKHCTKACYHAARLAKVMIPCGTCGEIFKSRPSMNGQYCSKACSGLAQRTRVARSCERCGEGFEVRASEATTARFCSKRCRALTLSVGIHVGIKNPGRLTRPTPYEKPGYIKLAGKVRKRDNYTCCKCGHSYPKGSRKLEVHHKTPIRDGGQDVMENLETLCVPCHRKIDAALRLAEGLPPAGRGCRPRA